MFWSGKTLSQRLPGDQLVVPFRADRVDCAAYVLSVGREIYVSPSDRSVEPETVTARRLEDGESVAIPPGQFAFLLTEERVAVPKDALGLISIRARKKFRGLVNVSGFHVDPGYCGQLTFAVFNAGPVAVHLKRGEPIFLLWYAQLDEPSEEYRKAGRVAEGLDTNVITGIAGELKSFSSLSKRIDEVEEGLTARVSRLEGSQEVVRALCFVILGAFVAMVVRWVSGL